MKNIKIFAVFMLLILPLLIAAQATEAAQLTIDMVVGAVGLVLTFVFAYFPKLNTWYASKDESYKKLLMAGLVVLFTAAAFGLGCFGYLEKLFQVTVACTQESAFGLLRAIVVGIMVNQSVFRLLPTTKKVKAAKAAQALALPKDSFPNAE